MTGSEVFRASFDAPDEGVVRALGDGRLKASGVEGKAFGEPPASAAGRPAGEADAWFESDESARFILDLNGRVLRANGSARELSTSGVVGSSGVFISSKHRSRGELDLLLKRLAEGRQTRGRILFRAGDDAWCILDLMTAPGAAGRVFAVVRPMKAPDVEKIDIMCSVFGLTRAEKSVLLHLANGESPKDIGRILDMSIHTVRSHLRSICMRMGVKGITGALRFSLQMT